MTTSYAVGDDPVNIMMAVREDRKMPPAPTPSQAALEAAACSQSPSGAHVWKISPLPEQIGECPHCHAHRQWGRPQEILTPEAALWKTRREEGIAPPAIMDPKRAATLALRASLVALEIGASCEAPHGHLRCGHPGNSRQSRCGLKDTMAALKRSDSTVRAMGWAYEHTATGVAIVRRIR